MIDLLYHFYSFLTIADNKKAALRRLVFGLVHAAFTVGYSACHRYNVLS